MRPCRKLVVLTGASGGISWLWPRPCAPVVRRVLAVAGHREPWLPLLERYPGALFSIAADLTFPIRPPRSIGDAPKNGEVAVDPVMVQRCRVNHFAMLEQLEDTDINAMLALKYQCAIA